MVDKFDVCAQESHVFQSLVQRVGSSRPHTRSLDVDTDEVFVGEQSCQAHGVFAAAAAQFQHDGIVVFKELAVPFSFQFERRGIYCHIRRLKYVRIGFHVGKFGEFILAHYVVISLRRFLLFEVCRCKI